MNTLNSQVSCELSIWLKIESSESQSHRSILRIGKLSKKQFRALKTKAELSSIFKYMHIIMKRQSDSIKAPKDDDRVKKTFQKYSPKRSIQKSEAREWQSRQTNRKKIQFNSN